AFRECLIEVSARNVTQDDDGILGASLFERFQIRIDARSRILELTPGEAGERKQGIPPLGLDRLLLVRTNVAGGREGWFLLGTGAIATRRSTPASDSPRRGGSRLSRRPRGAGCTW